MIRAWCLKVRTVRRMAEEFRWNADMLQDIRFTPWKPTPGKSAQIVGRNMYITERMIDAHGRTDSCRKCSTGHWNHSEDCRQRFEKIQYDLLQEKIRQAPIIPEDSGEQTVVKSQVQHRRPVREFDRREAVFMGQNILM